jgi:hypothetical protein
MQTVFESAKQLDLRVFFTDTDLSLIQECIAEATNYPGLSESWRAAIGSVVVMMDSEQRDWYRFERMHPEILDAVVFGGGEDDPIIVEDDEL